MTQTIKHRDKHGKQLSVEIRAALGEVITQPGTVQGYETINMLRKGQIRGVEKADGMKQVTFIASLFEVAVSSEQESEILRPRNFLSDFCNATLRRV